MYYFWIHVFETLIICKNTFRQSYLHSCLSLGIQNLLGNLLKNLQGFHFPTTQDQLITIDFIVLVTKCRIKLKWDKGLIKWTWLTACLALIVFNGICFRGFPTSLHHSWSSTFVIRNDTSIWYISWSETGRVYGWRGRIHWNRNCISISCTLAKILWFSVDSCKYKYANIWTIKIVVQGYLVSWFAYMTFPRIEAFQAVRYIYLVVYLWVRIHGRVCRRIWRRPWAVSYISSVSRFPANTI